MDRRSLIRTCAVGALMAGCARRGDATTDTSTRTTSADDVGGAIDQTSQPRTTPNASVPPESPTPGSSTSTAAAAPWAGTDFAGLDTFVESTGGDALAIVAAGSVVHEWYRDGDPTYARDIASAQKSVLSMLVGIAVDRSLLAIDATVDSVLGPGWATGETSTITVEHLLTMTSGLDNAYRVIDRPGMAWRYNNAFSKLFDVLEHAVGRNIDDIAAEWLFEPVGASGATFRVRSEVGAGVGAGYGLVCSATQLAAVGASVLGASPPVSRAWLDASWVPSQTFNLAYGQLWWLNGQASYIVPEGLAFDGPLIPNASSDLVAALGKDDQKLYVCRSLDLVVVRLGAKADPTARLALSEFDNDLWALLDP